jgi:hypothetical protein
MKTIILIFIFLALMIIVVKGQNTCTCITGNCQEGYGVAVSSSGAKYEGNWSIGYLNGNGTLTLPDGTKKTGYWMNGFLGAFNGTRYIGNCPPTIQYQNVDFSQLSQRFRPYLKFSNDGGDETIKPCSWQWFFNRSNLF